MDDAPSDETAAPPPPDVDSITDGIANLSLDSPVPPVPAPATDNVATTQVPPPTGPAATGTPPVVSNPSDSGDVDMTDAPPQQKPAVATPSPSTQTQPTSTQTPPTNPSTEPDNPGPQESSQSAPQPQPSQTMPPPPTTAPSVHGQHFLNLSREAADPTLTPDQRAAKIQQRNAAFNDLLNHVSDYSPQQDLAPIVSRNLVRNQDHSGDRAIIRDALYPDLNKINPNKLGTDDTNCHLAVQNTDRLLDGQPAQPVPKADILPWNAVGQFEKQMGSKFGPSFATIEDTVRALTALPPGSRAILGWVPPRSPNPNGKPNNGHLINVVRLPTGHLMFVDGQAGDVATLPGANDGFSFSFMPTHVPTTNRSPGPSQPTGQPTPWPTTPNDPASNTATGPSAPTQSPRSPDTQPGPNQTQGYGAPPSHSTPLAPAHQPGAQETQTSPTPPTGNESAAPEDDTPQSPDDPEFHTPPETPYATPPESPTEATAPPEHGPESEPPRPDRVQQAINKHHRIEHERRQNNPQDSGPFETEPTKKDPFRTPDGGQVHRILSYYSGELPIHAATLALDPKAVLEIRYDATYDLDSKLTQLHAQGESHTSLTNTQLDELAGAGRRNAERMRNDLKSLGIEESRVRLIYDNDITQPDPNAKRHVSDTHREIADRFMPPGEKAGRREDADAARQRQARDARRHADNVAKARQTLTDTFFSSLSAERKAELDNIVHSSEQITVGSNPNRHQVPGLGLKKKQPVILVWLRRSGGNIGGAYPELDTPDEMFEQIVDRLKSGGTDGNSNPDASDGAGNGNSGDNRGFPDARIIPIGDEPGPGLRERHGGPDGLFGDGRDLVKFWDKYGLTNRAEQWYLLHLLQQHHDAKAVGMESGAIEGPALLGMPTVYLERRAMRFGKAPRWAYVSGAQTGDPAAGPAQPHHGPVPNWRRQQFEAPTEWLRPHQQVRQLVDDLNQTDPGREDPPDAELMKKIGVKLDEWHATAIEYDEQMTATDPDTADWVTASQKMTTLLSGLRSMFDSRFTELPLPDPTSSDNPTPSEQDPWVPVDALTAALNQFGGTRNFGDTPSSVDEHESDSESDGGVPVDEHESDSESDGGVPVDDNTSVDGDEDGGVPDDDQGPQDKPLKENALAQEIRLTPGELDRMVQQLHGFSKPFTGQRNEPQSANPLVRESHPEFVRPLMFEAVRINEEPDDTSTAQGPTSAPGYGSRSEALDDNGRPRLVPAFSAAPSPAPQPTQPGEHDTAPPHSSTPPESGTAATAPADRDESASRHGDEDSAESAPDDSHPRHGQEHGQGTQRRGPDTTEAPDDTTRSVDDEQRTDDGVVAPLHNRRGDQVGTGFARRGGTAPSADTKDNEPDPRTDENPDHHPPRGRRHPAPRFTVRSHFDERRVVYRGVPVTDYTVKVAFHPDTDPAVAEDMLARLRQGVNSVFNRRLHPGDPNVDTPSDDTERMPPHTLPNGDRLNVTIEEAKPGETPHLTVGVGPPGGTMDQTSWPEDATPAELAHEIGHQLGLRDEYRNDNAPGRAHVPGSLMGDLPTDRSPHDWTRSDLPPRYLQLMSAGTGSVPTHTADPADTWEEARKNAPSLTHDRTWVDPVSTPDSQHYDGDTAVPAQAPRGASHDPNHDANEPFQNLVYGTGYHSLSDQQYLNFVENSTEDMRPLAYVVNIIAPHSQVEHLSDTIDAITRDMDPGYFGRVAFVIGINYPKNAPQGEVTNAMNHARGVVQRRSIPVALVWNSWENKESEFSTPGTMRNNVMHSEPTVRALSAFMRNYHPYLSFQDFDTGSRLVPSGQHVFRHFEEKLLVRDDRNSMEDVDPVDNVYVERPLMFAGGYRAPDDDLEPGQFNALMRRIGQKSRARNDDYERFRDAVERDMKRRDKLTSINQLSPYAPEPNLFVDGPAALLRDPSEKGWRLNFGQEAGEFNQLSVALNNLNAWELTERYTAEFEGAFSAVPVGLIDPAKERATRSDRPREILPRDQEDIEGKVRADAENNRLPYRERAFVTDFKRGAVATDLTRLLESFLRSGRLPQQHEDLTNTRKRFFSTSKREYSKGTSLGSIRDAAKKGGAANDPLAFNDRGSNRAWEDGLSQAERAYLGDAPHVQINPAISAPLGGELGRRGIRAGVGENQFLVAANELAMSTDEIRAKRQKTNRDRVQSHGYSKTGQGLQTWKGRRVGQGFVQKPPARSIKRHDTDREQLSQQLNDVHMGPSWRPNYQLVPPDGNCLYHAVNLAIKSFQNMDSHDPEEQAFFFHHAALALRQHIGEWFSNHLDQVVPLAMEKGVDAKELYRLIVTDGAWADDAGDLAPVIIASALGARLRIWKDDGQSYMISPLPGTVPVSSGFGNWVIDLSLSNNHYELRGVWE